MKNFALAAVVLSMVCQPDTKAQVMGNAQYDSPRSAGNSIYNDSKSSRPADRFQNNNYFNVNDSTVIVSVNGLINVLPDTYVATFNLVQSGESAEMTDRLMRERIDRFKINLRGLHVETSDISTDLISLVPKYGIETDNRIFSKTYTEVPAGFEMQKTLSIRYKTAGQLDEFVTHAAQSEIYDLVNVACFSSKMESFKDSLRAKCISEVKNRVKTFESLNLKLDTLKKTVGEDFHVTLPETRYRGYQAFARTSLKSDKKGNLNEAEKAVSQYYKPVTYEDFDVIINPVVSEPMIQVTYQIIVKYHLKPMSKYYVITPAGESKRLILR